MTRKDGEAAQARTRWSGTRELCGWARKDEGRGALQRPLMVLLTMSRLPRRHTQIENPLES